MSLLFEDCKKEEMRSQLRKATTFEHLTLGPPQLLGDMCRAGGGYKHFAVFTR